MSFVFSFADAHRANNPKPRRIFVIFDIANDQPTPLAIFRTNKRSKIGEYITRNPDRFYKLLSEIGIESESPDEIMDALDESQCIVEVAEDELIELD